MRGPGRSAVRLGLIACLGATAWGCGSRPVPPSVPSGLPVAATLLEDAPDCALVAGAGEPVASVALNERVNPANAPHPANDSERLVFRQLYETLVRIDCEGQVRPGLAAAWHRDPEEDAWMVTLRDEARFSDGTPVTAADVLSSWMGDGLGNELRPEVRRHVASVVPLDERTLAITAHGEESDAPVVLADTDLAIARRAAGSAWPIGTRGTRVAQAPATQDPGTRTVITLVGPAEASNALAPAGLPWSLQFHVAPDRDRRDFLDEGIDLLLTRDPAALDYAATLPQFQLVPLPWHRTQVFVSAWRGRSVSPLPSGARQTLAKDAVRGEARGAEGPFWWEALPECDLATPRPPDRAASMGNRIVYDRNDDASRDLAERFVGLSRIQGSGAAAILDALLPNASRQFHQAIGLDGEALVSAQSGGADAGYILSLDRRPLAPCQSLRALAGRIRWLEPGAIVPLVDTRLQALLRRGRSGVTGEWDGGLLLTPSEGWR